MKVKTQDLTGIALDWAVAKCEGSVTELAFDGIAYGFKLDGNLKVLAKGWAPSMSWYPSSNWAQGGPIIEREEIGLRMNVPCSPGRTWEGRPSPLAKGAGGKFGYGPTPLIAAMRCLVASKLGEEVEIPESLK